MVKGGDGATIALGICLGYVVTIFFCYHTREMEKVEGRTIGCHPAFDSSRVGDMR